MSLTSLLKEHTNLDDEDIEELLQISKTLPMISDLVNADVFIDCLTADKDKAIVVAEGKPREGSSNYKNSVIGKFALRENEPAALNTLNTGAVNKELKAITQEEKIVSQDTAPIRNSKGEVIAVLIIEKKAKEVEGNNSEEFFNLPLFDNDFEIRPDTFDYVSRNIDFIAENIDNSIVLFNNKGVAVYANKCARELYENLGKDGEILGKELDDLTLDGLTLLELNKKCTDKRDSLISEIDILDFYLEISYNFMLDEEEIIGINMIVKDLTEKKNKEKELILKSVVIKEIHHRVKNNLQTVVSLLRLQSRRVNDDYLKKAFNDSISRIMSISVTHELLAKQGIDRVGIKDILTKLTENMINYVEGPDLNLKIYVIGDDFLIDSEASTAIALCVNELIQNSIEHGFKNKNEGKIILKIEKKEKTAIIRVSDNGNGFEKENINDNSLGLNIVEQLVKDKLKGNMKINTNDQGTEVIIDIKLNN